MKRKGRSVLTPHQRIVRAAKRGTGCYLTADDCYLLGEIDDAIYYRATLDDERMKLGIFKPKRRSGGGSR